MEQTVHSSTRVYISQPRQHNGTNLNLRGIREDIFQHRPRTSSSFVTVMVSLLPFLNLQFSSRRTRDHEPGYTYVQRGRLIRRNGPQRQTTGYAVSLTPAYYALPVPVGPCQIYYDVCEHQPRPPRDPARHHASNIRRIEQELRQLRGEESDDARHRRRRYRSSSPSTTTTSSSRTSSSSSSSRSSDSNTSSASYHRIRRPSHPYPPHHRRYGDDEFDSDYAWDQGYGPPSGRVVAMPRHHSFRGHMSMPHRGRRPTAHLDWQDIPHFDPCQGHGVIREPRGV
jgi:hypothetical protein